MWEYLIGLGGWLKDWCWLMKNFDEFQIVGDPFGGLNRHQDLLSLMIMSHSVDVLVGLVLDQGPLMMSRKS